jgi:hypothetical protein
MKTASISKNTHQSITYTLLVVSLLGLFIFQMTSTVLVTMYPGLDFIKNAISILVYLPFGWTQTVAFYLFGVSLLAVAVLIQLKVPAKLNKASIVLSIMAFAFFLIGTFPTRLPGGPITLYSAIHAGATMTVVMAFPLACFMMASILKARNLRYMYIYSIVAGIFQVLFIFIGGYFLHGSTGIYERVLLWNGQLWITSVCLSLLSAEIRERLSKTKSNYLIAHLSVLGSLYMYVTILWPLCLPLIYKLLT